MRNLRRMYLSRLISSLLYNLTDFTVMSGSYYMNVIFIAGSVDAVGI